VDLGLHQHQAAEDVGGKMFRKEEEEYGDGLMDDLRRRMHGMNQDLWRLHRRKMKGLNEAS